MTQLKLLLQILKWARLCIPFVAILCLLLTATLLGVRIQNSSVKTFQKINFIQFLVLGVYVNCIIFLFTTSVLFNGIRLFSFHLCHSSIFICLACYFVTKKCMYMFLVERAHIARTLGLCVSRWRDWIWLVGTSIIGSGLLAVMVAGFELARFSVSEDTCRIGVDNKATFIVFGLDTFVNLGLSGFFVYLLFPMLRFSRRMSDMQSLPPDTIEWQNNSIGRVKEPTVLEVSIPASKSKAGGRRKSVNFIRLERLFKKTIAGALLLLLPTIANAIGLAVFHGSEKA